MLHKYTVQLLKAYSKYFGENLYEKRLHRAGRVRAPFCPESQKESELYKAALTEFVFIIRSEMPESFENDRYALLIFQGLMQYIQI